MADPAITDLSIQKSADDYTPQLGQEVTWTITVSNIGESFAENVRVDDLLPEGMEFRSGNASSGNLEVSEGLWTIGGLEVGQTATASVTMVVTDVDDYINNYATVSTDTHDCNPSNDTNTIAVDPWEPTNADLSLTKTVSNPEPEVGEVVEWVVTVTNSGPDTAWHSKVSEALPDGLTFVGARASSGAYVFESGVWNVGHLADGESAEMTISTRVDTEAGAQYVNTAVASSNTADNDQSNNAAEAVVTVAETTVIVSTETESEAGIDGATCVACLCACEHQVESGADLQIVKLVDNPTPNLNGEVVWTILVTNNGPDDAENVVVNDNLPGGVEYVSDSTTLGEFDDAAGSWQIGDLANGESALLQITTIATDAAAVQTNIALVTSDTEDSNPENNIAVASIDAVDADLAISKTVDEPAPNLGDEVVWTIEVVNNGPDTAENVVLKDALPEGTTFVSSSNTELSAEGEVALGNLASGESVSLDITVTVDDADGARTNTASVTSDTYDSNLANNEDSAVVDAIAADLMIEKSVSDPTPDLGSEVVWTIVVTNNGPDTAENVSVRDVQPVGTTFISSSDDRFVPETGEIDLGDLDSGESVSIDIVVKVDDAEGARVNTASVTSDTYDNDDSNNEDDAEVDAIAADLMIEKSVNDPAPDLGSEVVWTIIVTNNGPDAAENVSVRDLQPAGTTFINSSDDRYVPETGEIELGDLDSGESVTLEITVKVDDAEGARVNTASVSSDTFDNDDSNNEDDAEVDAIAADLMIEKSASDPAPDLGSEVVWTIVVTNNGPDAAESVVVTDALPSGTTFVKSNDVRFDSVKGEIALGNLASGDSVSFEVTVTVDEVAPQVNTATVTSATYDNDSTNNEDEATIDAVAADLELVKEVVPQTAAPGESVEWTLTVVNKGPDAATGVAVKDVLPDGVSYLGNSTDGDVTHLSFLGDSWMVDSRSGSIVDPVTEYFESTQGSVTSDTFAISGHTVAEMLAESDWQPALEGTVADTVITAFGVNEYIAGTTPADYQADLEELFGVIAGLSPTTDIVFLIPAETEVNDPVAPWGEYVDAAIAATTTAQVTAINLGEFIQPYAQDPTLWEDTHHIGEQAGAVVAQAVSEGYVLAEPEFNASEGVWTIGDLAVNETATLTIEAEVVDTGELTNLAQVVSADQVDPDSTVNNNDGDRTGDQLEDDEDSVVLTVPETIDLELEQLITDGNSTIESAIAGDTVAYTITVTNVSTVPASGVSVSTQLADLFSSGDLDYVSSNGDFNPDTGVWIIDDEDLKPGDSITLAVSAVVNTPGTLENIAQVATADQEDIDSTPGNDIAEEDDQAVVSLEVVEPVPVFAANPNELTVEGSGGASINAVVVIDRSSSMKEPIEIDGVTQTRLEWNIQAVEDFAARPEVKAVKVIAFDAQVTDEGVTTYNGGASNAVDKNHIPSDEVSDWLDLSTPEGVNSLEEFLADLAPYGSGTNYQAAIDATMAQTDVPPVGAEETNYYFFSDGKPTQGGLTDTHRITNEQEWQAFAEANFDNTYAVGFGGAISVRDALEQIAHVNGEPDDSSVADDPNLLLVSEIDAVPSVLSNFASTSVTGNAIVDDISETDISITSMVFDGVTYTYAEGEISESGPSQDAFLTKSFVVVDSVQEGSLQFDFETGDFTYFSPTTDTDITEAFEYMIIDAEGAESSATVTINVTPSPDAVTPIMPALADPNPVTVASLLSDDDDEMFASDSMASVELPEPVAKEWAGDSTQYHAELYDVLSLVV